MQYLLTKEEYELLFGKIDDAETKAQTTINELCTFIADNVPQHDWRNGSNPDNPTPWGCIYTAIAEDPDDEWFCDECPAQKWCTQQKHYSK